MPMDKEDFYTLHLMGEIERNNSPSQRELSHNLNLSLGLVNTFLKRLVNKGYFKVRTMPRNRVKYLLTPKGVAQKSRLTVKYLRYSVNFYKDVKNLLLNTYSELEMKDVNTILFFGAGEVAELAYLYLQLTNMKLAGIIDDRKNGKYFFGYKIEGLDRLRDSDWDVVLLTRLDETDRDMALLSQANVSPERIATL